MINSASIGNDIISYVYVGDFEIFGIPYPLEVLRDDNIGLWWNFKDSDTLSQTISPFTRVNNGDPVATVYDKGMHGINGTQPITTKRMRYDITNGVVSSDMVDDGLDVSFPNSINSAYMVVDNYMGVYTYRINLAVNNSFISTSYNNKYLWNNVKNIFISTTLNDIEQSNIEKYYRNNNTPSIIEDFSNTWRSCSSLTKFPLINTSSGTNFSNAWSGCSSLTEFPLINTSSGTNFSSTWQNCSSLTQFPSIVTSSGTNFSSTWRNCSKLAEFPLINTSSGTNFSNAWQNCSSLTKFPSIVTSSGTNFSNAWQDCKLTSFPLLDTSNSTNFSFAWYGNNLTSFPLLDTSKGVDFSAAWRFNKLTSFPLLDTSKGTNFSTAWFSNNLTTFPLIDVSSGTNFSLAWRDNNFLVDFPEHIFDNIKGGNFNYAFENTNLSQSSIDGILVSLVTSGISTGTRIFGQKGGSAPSATGKAAIDTLRARGWAISVTGGY